MGTFCRFLPFFPIFGLFLLQKHFQYCADPDVFRNHNPKFSGAPEYPEESFFRQNKSPKKVERSSTPLFLGIFLSGTQGHMHNVIFFLMSEKFQKKNFFEILISEPRRLQEPAPPASAFAMNVCNENMHASVLAYATYR
jgi:hypothetical protein